MSGSGVCVVCGLPVDEDVCLSCIDSGMMSRKTSKLNSGVSHSVPTDISSIRGHLAELGVGV